MQTIKNINLTVSTFKQNKQYVAYTPALDFSAVGKTQTQAKKNFAEAVMIFLEELYKAGTIKDVLTELGWQQKARQWEPPKMISQETIGLQMPAMA